MAATATPNVNHNTNYTAHMFGRGGFIEVGTWTPSALGSYTTVGEVVTFGCKAKPNIVIFMPQLNFTAPTTGSANSVDYRWDFTNGTVRAFPGSTSVGTTAWPGAVFGGPEGSTTFAAPTTVAIPYIAFSW